MSPCAVAQDLHFDVAGAAHEAFQEDRAVAERGGGFAAGFIEEPPELGGVIHHAHAASAAAEGRLDDQREAGLARSLLGLPHVGDRLFGAGNHRDSGLPREAPRGGLVAQKFQDAPGGPDERDAGAFAGLGQRGVLGQEAVARMDGVDALLQRQRDNALDVEIGLHRTFAFAHQVGFVGLEPVQGQAVFLGIDGHRAQAQFVGRAQDADGDFTAIQG